MKGNTRSYRMICTAVLFCALIFVSVFFALYKRSPHDALGSSVSSSIYQRQDSPQAKNPKKDEKKNGGVGDGTNYVLSDLSLEKHAAEVLKTYKQQGKCTLVQATYLDLKGTVWGCVVQGDQWVDICIIKKQKGKGSTLTVRHLSAKDVLRELQNQDSK